MQQAPPRPLGKKGRGVEIGEEGDGEEGGIGGGIGGAQGTK